MNSYEAVVTFGWMMIIIGFFGAILSNYDFYTIFLLPIFLLIILCGMIVWYYAIKGRKTDQKRIWSEPKTLQEMTGLVTVGNIVMWAVVYGVKIIASNGSPGPLWVAALFLLFTLFVYIVFGTLYIIIGLKIKKENDKIEENLKLV